MSAEIVNGGVPAANEPAPRSDAPPAANGDPFARPNSANAPDPNELKPSADANALKPNGPPDPNELTPAADAQSAVAGSQPATPPVKVNEIQRGQAAASGSTAASASSTSNLASDQEVSSSKKKKKKGLKKIMPF